jgi:type I restriction enzyme S subunit
MIKSLKLLKKRARITEIPAGWTLVPVGSACSIQNEKRTPISSEDRAASPGEYPYYGPTGVLDHISEFRYDGRFALIGEDGDHFIKYLEKNQTLLVDGKFSVNNHAHVIDGTADCSAEWFAWYFRHRSLRSLLTRQGASRYKLTKEALQSLPILLPPSSEQSRITGILRTHDEAIDITEKLLIAKRSLFQAIASNVFERALTAPSKVCAANEMLATVSERSRPDLPLLAVMQDVGVVRRDELDRRVTMPEGDGSTYKVARPGDFIISLRSFEGGLEYCDVEGLVSPAYTVLRPKVPIDNPYYRHYFKSRSFVRRLDGLVFGIRDGKQIAFRDFGGMAIPAPSSENQKQVADILNTAQRDCELVRQLVGKLERQKRGLMQKLLTGEWRVPVRDRDVDAMAARVAEEAAQ